MHLQQLLRFSSQFPNCKGRYVFYCGGRGWDGPLEGRVISKYFTNWGGQTCLIRSRGTVTVFFGKENITRCRLVDFYLLTNTRSV